MRRGSCMLWRVVRSTSPDLYRYAQIHACAGTKKGDGSNCSHMHHLHKLVTPKSEFLTKKEGKAKQMKQLTKIMVGILVASTLLPISSVYSQTAAKKTLPKVPITYSGDTDKTIMRRAQWIEGAKKEGNAVTWWSIGSPTERKEIVAEFNKVYPSIKVEYWRGQTEEIATKIEMEFSANRRTVDVVLGGDTSNFPRWRKMGRLEKFTDLIPGLAKWDKRFYSTTGDTAQAGSNAITPQYNTNLVSAAEVPRSWEDLLNPKWKGQLGVQTDPRAWWTMALAEGGWGLEKTIDFVTKLRAQKPSMQTGPSQGHALLIAGNFKIYTNAVGLPCSDYEIAIRWVFRGK